MKRICIISDTLAPAPRLIPLINAIQEDETLELSVLTSCRHLGPDMEIQYSAMVSSNADEPWECLDIRVHAGKSPCKASKISRDGLYLALKTISPDIVVVTGNTHEAFSAAVAACLNDIPVAHINGGERQFGPFENNFCLGIAKIANLHFTATETYRKRVIGFGEHPDRVFNVGTLSATPLNGSTETPDTDCIPALKDPVSPFLFISMVPDRSLGSRNAAMMASVMSVVSDPLFKKYALVCLEPGPKGFGRIMRAEMDKYLSPSSRHCTFIQSDSEIASAMAHAQAVLGNTDECVVLGARMKTPVVSVGDRIRFRDNPGHMIQAEIDSILIKEALNKALCPEFKTGLLFWESPFDRPDTTDRIKEILKAYTPEDIMGKTCPHIMQN